MEVLKGIDSMKKKILIIHNYYQIPGGEDVVVENEKKLLEDYGHEVILYSKNNSELKSLSLIQKVLLPFTTIFNYKTYRVVKKIICNNKIDIVHVHNTLNLVSPSVYYAAFACKTPVVQTVHNFRLLCPGATFFRDGDICEDCVSKGLICAVKHRCYRESRFQTLACVISTWIHRMLGTYRRLNYICLTEFNKEKLLNLKKINSEKVFVKPNFVYSKFKTENVSSENRNYYIFAGRLDELKGIRILFEAWKSMGILAPKLIVCGTGPMDEWCREFLSNNADCNIEMKGFVANIDNRKLITNAKALILPTQWYEGFPMTIVEAYSVGTPVIGSDIGNVGSLIQNGITGWTFKHDSKEALVVAVKKAQQANLVVDRTQVDQYSVENNYKKLSEIYEKIGR